MSYFRQSFSLVNVYLACCLLSYTVTMSVSLGFLTFSRLLMSLISFGVFLYVLNSTRNLYQTVSPMFFYKNPSLFQSLYPYFYHKNFLSIIWLDRSHLIKCKFLSVVLLNFPSTPTMCLPKFTVRSFILPKKKSRYPLPPW